MVRVSGTGEGMAAVWDAVRVSQYYDVGEFQKRRVCVTLERNNCLLAWLLTVYDCEGSVLVERLCLTERRRCLPPDDNEPYVRSRRRIPPETTTKASTQTKKRLGSCDPLWLYCLYVAIDQQL